MHVVLSNNNNRIHGENTRTIARAHERLFHNLNEKALLLLLVVLGLALMMADG